MAVSRAHIETYKAFMRRGAFDEALQHLQGLLESHRKDPGLLTAAAPLAMRLGASDLAVTLYLRLMHIPGIPADDLFNIGRALKSLGQYDNALRAYDMSLSAGIGRPEDVHQNMGVILADECHDNARAAKAFQTAIKLNPQSLGSYINLGNLYEETGAFGSAERIYSAAIAEIPNGYEALARLANAHEFTSEDDPLLETLTRAVQSSYTNDFEKECLHTALGTAYDRLGKFETAWMHYSSANACGLRYGRPYNPDQFEAYCDAIIAAYSPRVFIDKPVALPGDSQPVFICGMFRSGSTLAEQLLAAHPAFTPLGECDFIPKLAQSARDFYPAEATSLSEDTKGNLAEQYRNQAAVKAVDTPFFTDKRPDNLLYLGLIKQLFPASKIVHTVREPLDNYLSIFFTQFSDSQAYSRRWEHIAHYHGQQSKLMAHWRALFGDDITQLSYDSFVSNPEHTAKSLMSELGAAWDPVCLDFYNQKNRVKTASYKQVRRPVYTSSSGRWKNYQDWMPAIRP